MRPNPWQLLALLSVPFFAQAQEMAPCQITGQVQDARNGQPIPYATVIELATPSGIVLNGTTTGEDGRFAVPSVQMEATLVVTFIGFKPDTLRDIRPQGLQVDVGIIALQPDQELLDVAEVQAEQSTTTFALDKRVFNVGKDLSTTGASALEVLNNVPSVTVSIEGEINLRGSGGVQILIDGKPSVLTDDPANALSAITADMIESIEVITNPSAKYEASGTSGILNIVLKKEEKEGLNGSISLNTGIPDNHSIGISLQRRASKFNLFTQMGAGYRSNPRFSENLNQDRGTGSAIESDGESFRNERFANITLGTDYHLNDLNVITLSGRFAYEWEKNPALTVFRELDGDGQAIAGWERHEETEATNPKWQFDLQYVKNFSDHKDHKLMMSALGAYFGKALASQYTNLVTLGSGTYEDQRTNTAFDRADYTFKIDYTHPVNEVFKFETGAQLVSNDVGNDFAVRDLIDGEYVANPDFTNDFSWQQQVLGAYVLASAEGERAGIQIGVRPEYTDVNTLLATTGETNATDYLNLFPSLHTSYKFSDHFSAQAGYSRRVSRPRLWDLNPFFNITNNFNIRTGNPNLQPEFSDSYEVTSIWILEKLSLNGSVYYRYTTDVVERISRFEDNVTLTTPENIGTNGTLGFEFNGKYKPNKWWSLNGDFNVNRFERLGEFEGQSFDFTGQQWTARLSNKFKLPMDFELEVTGDYRSGFRTVQGDVTGFGAMDLGVRKKVFGGKIVCNLGVRDVFASRIRESIIDRGDFFVSSRSYRGRFVTFGVSYGFGKGEAMTYGGGRRY